MRKSNRKKTDRKEQATKKTSSRGSRKGSGVKSSSVALQLPGNNAILEVLDSVPERIQSLIVDAERKDKPGIQGLLSLASKKNVAAKLLSRAEFDSQAGDEKNQGALALLTSEGGKELEDIIEAALLAEASQLILVLDQLNDTNNLGTIFRLAAASGVAGIILTKDNSAEITPSVRRVSMGGTELVPWSAVKNLHRSIQQLKENNIWVYGASSHSALGKRSVESIYDLDLPRPLALVLGSEQSGIRRLTEESCDGLLRLPMSGRMESLNVSQAASALVFEILRQFRSA